jgi:precorrin-6Y C5,15-methyltransferase (decarboxylating)
VDVPPLQPSRLTVVGIGADGWAGLPERLRDRVLAADAVLGGPRHLALVPPVEGQVREPWPRPLRDGLPVLLERYDACSVVALASGDPLVSGIGATLVELLGAERVEVEPAVSSVALARARMRWPEESVAVVSLVGRDPHLVLRELAPGRRILVLSSDEATPAVVAGLLVEQGCGDSRLTVLGDLGSAAESRVSAPARAWCAQVSRLNVVAVEVVQAPGGSSEGSWATGLPDSCYEHDGQLSKRDVRASALARLAPRPGELLWDVGAGAGSVAVEWMRAHPTCRAVAVESDPGRAARIGRNAATLGVPTLQVVEGTAPEALADLPPPDAVFVGGGATRAGVLPACLAALRPGGRLVAHGVTLETETLLARLYGEHGGELTRISVEHAAPIGSFTGWTPARAVTQWAVRVPT